MAEVQTNLRQAIARIIAEGIVSEKNLEVKTEDNKTKITGSLTVKTSDVNFVKYNVNINEKTNAGNDNKAYAGMLTVMNEYKSIAEVGEAEADRVRVTGDLNIYHSVQSNSDIVTYRSNFFNRLQANDELNPRAEFDVEVFISSIVPEMDTNGDETGRIVVNGWVPTYNGIEPVKLFADAEVGAAIEATFEPGQTVRFSGEVINNRITVVKEIPVVIGKPRQEVKTTFKNELLITGASAAYEEDDEDPAKQPYAMDAVKLAIQVRNEKIEADKAKAQSGNNRANNNSRPSGAAHGRTLGF